MKSKAREIERILRKFEFGSARGAIQPVGLGVKLGSTCFVCGAFQEEGHKGVHLPGCAFPKMFKILDRIKVAR